MNRVIFITLVIGCIAVGVLMFLKNFYGVFKSYREAKSHRERRSIGIYFLATIAMLGVVLALQVFSPSKIWRYLSLAIVFLVLVLWVLHSIWKQNKIQEAIRQHKWRRKTDRD